MNLLEQGISLSPPGHDSCGNKPLQVARRPQLKHEDRCSNGHTLPRRFSLALPPRYQKIIS